MKLLRTSLLAVLVLTACQGASLEPEFHYEVPEVELGAWYDVYLESQRPAPAASALPPASYGYANASSSDWVTRIYDVSDLLAGVADYNSPNVGDLRRNEDQPGYGEGPVAERVAFTNEDALLDLIQQSIAPGTWDDDGVSLRIANGKLIVRQRR